MKRRDSAPPWVWIAVVDGAGARLMRGRSVHPGRGERLRLEEVESLENPWEELAGTDPPSEPLVGSRRSELLARFAVDAAKWLLDVSRKRRVAHLHVLASTRRQALLRSIIGQVLSPSISYGDPPDVDSLPELERAPELFELLAEERESDSRRAS